MIYFLCKLRRLTVLLETELRKQGIIMFMQPNITTEKTSIYNSGFIAYVVGDDIYQMDYYGGNKQAVGKTMRAYNELQELANKYYEKLVELGIIPKEKSPEEVAEENAKQFEETKNTLRQNQELMAMMMTQMQQLQETVASLQKETSLKETNPLSDLNSTPDVNYYLNKDINNGYKPTDTIKDFSPESGSSRKKEGTRGGNK